MTIFNVLNNPVRIVDGDSDDPTPCTVFNRDIIQQVIVGNGSNIGGGSSSNLNQYSILDPLGTLSFDGSEDVWASTITAGITAMIDVVPGVTAVSVSPALIAAQIAAGGTFQVTKETLAVGPSQIGQPMTIAGSTTDTFGPFAITQSGYSIAFSLTQLLNTESKPFCSIDMQWSSSASGQLVARERWFPSQGNGVGSPAVYYGTGPTKGDQLTIQITNQAIASVTLNFFIITENSRTIPRDDWRQNTQPNVPTFISASYEQSGNVLMATAPAVGANTSTTRIMPLYAGLVNVAFVPPSGIAAPGGRFVINNEGARNTSAALAALTVAQTNDSVNSQNFQCYLPRAVCSLTIFNDSAGAGTFSASIQIAESPQ